LVNDLGDAIERDPEVRQARMIAEAARTRLLACMSGPEDGIDLAEAQGMLDALKDARALAEDAEDRVLLHRGLLAPAEADQRTVGRRAALARSGEPARPAARRAARVRDLRAGRVIASALVLALLGVAIAALAQRRGLRLPPARW
jgi:hypothetical protein